LNTQDGSEQKEYKTGDVEYDLKIQIKSITVVAISIAFNVLFFILFIIWLVRYCRDKREKEKKVKKGVQEQEKSDDESMPQKQTKRELPLEESNDMAAFSSHRDVSGKPL